jgi:hypothetical protein
MGREELNKIVKQGPVRIRVNDGSAYEIMSSELVTVSDIAASILYRANDGKWRHVYLPLVTMSVIEPIDAA